MRILYVTDLHQVFKNPANRTDLIREGIDIINKIAEELVVEHRIDAIIQGGDLCDRDYTAIPTTINSEFQNAHKRLSEKVNGNLYINMGNHEHNYSKDNPAFTIIDMQSERVKELYKYKEYPKTVLPIYKAVDVLEFGSTEIHFISYSPEKDYKIPLKDDNKFIIGLYHDDLVSFESEMELYHHRLGHGINMASTDIFDNVNVAILAHIHKPLIPFRLDNYRKTLVINPGSIVNRTVAEKHTKVSLPVIDIQEDGVNIEFAELQLKPFEDSFKEEVVEENSMKAEMVKIMKESKSLGIRKLHLEDIITEIENVNVRKLIIDSINPLVSKTEAEILKLEI